MTDEIERILDKEDSYEEMLAGIRRELSVSQRAYAGLEAENAKLLAEKEELERHNEELTSQLKVRPHHVYTGFMLSAVYSPTAWSC